MFESFLLKVWRSLALAKHSQLQVMRLMNDQFLIGVTGVIFNDNLEILLVKHSYRRVPWSLPGGFLQAGEHPKKGLEREVHEETNFTVHVEKIIKTTHDKKTARLDMCYIGTYKKGHFQPSKEVLEANFFPKNKLPPIINDQYKQIDLGYKRYTQLHSIPLMRRLSNYFRFR